MVELFSIRRDDPSTLLTPMLKGIETQINMVGRFRMIVDTEDPTHEILSFRIRVQGFEGSWVQGFHSLKMS
jgi:hypothetical protein